MPKPKAPAAHGASSRAFFAVAEKTQRRFFAPVNLRRKPISEGDSVLMEQSDSFARKCGIERMRTRHWVDYDHVTLAVLIGGLGVVAAILITSVFTAVLWAQVSLSTATIG
jgi:hypothetical protein